jgi:hypothetical protein
LLFSECGGRFVGQVPKRSANGLSGLRTSIDVIARKHENFEFDTGNFTDSFRFDARLKLFEFTLKNLYRREI